MLDQNGNRNHGWRVRKTVKHEKSSKISNGSEYAKGVELTKCKFCPKYVPMPGGRDYTFHFESCPGQD